MRSNLLILRCIKIFILELANKQENNFQNLISFFYITKHSKIVVENYKKNLTSLVLLQNYKNYRKITPISVF
jgi:hypothetical protein